MSDTIFCLSNPEEPGLVRLVAQLDSEAHHSGRVDRTICKDGEQIDWSLKVCDAGSTMKAFHRSLRRYRKNRGKGTYRCCAMDARAVAIRYVTLRPRGWNYASQSVGDDRLATILILAFLLSIVGTQAVELGTAHTLAITASVLTALTIGVAFLRNERSN